MKNSLTISSLQTGGLVVNYHCSSRCRHCLYASSPNWPKEYCTPERAEANLRAVRRLGATSVHIGGGEPLLNRTGILGVLKAARRCAVAIEYIETNASWQVDDAKTADFLNELMANGVGTLLVSMSPYHNEFIPFAKVQSLLAACEKAGMGVFPWVARFEEPLSKRNTKKVHPMGDGDLISALKAYPMNLRGRALTTYRPFLAPKPLKEILDSAPCGELSETSHFHVDLFGGYIPGLCSGFSVRVEDLGGELDGGKYPLMTMLHQEGVRALVAFAQGRGFVPAESYVSKCDACLEARRFLVDQDETGEFTELGPKPYYKEVVNRG